MRLDHVSYVASHHDFIDVVQRLGAELGAPFRDGGRHPRFGTQNFVLPLGGRTYLEVVSPMEHPSTDTAPFGRAVRQRAELGGGWLGWVVSVDDIAPIEHRLERAAVDGNRHRPDGFDLQWKQIGVKGLLADPQLPFFVQWLVDSSQHPSFNGSNDLRIERLEICGDAATISAWLGEPATHPLDDVEVDWVDAEEAGLVAVHFATAHGVVRVD